MVINFVSILNNTYIKRNQGLKILIQKGMKKKLIINQGELKIPKSSGKQTNSVNTYQIKPYVICITIFKLKVLEIKNKNVVTSITKKKDFNGN